MTLLKEFFHMGDGESPKLKLDLECVVADYVRKFQAAAVASSIDSLQMDVIADLLRGFARDIESAEGEDPESLEPSGPTPITTGGEYGG